MSKELETPAEDMVVDLELDNGETVSCDVLTVLEVEGKDYIALLPQNQDEENAEVWFYQLKENSENPDDEPELIYIESEEEYDKVADKFDEFLDTLEFEEME